jgi:hypothetical protein
MDIHASLNYTRKVLACEQPMPAPKLMLLASFFLIVICLSKGGLSQLPVVPTKAEDPLGL